MDYKKILIDEFVPDDFINQAKEHSLLRIIQHVCEHHQYHHEKEQWLTEVIEEGRKILEFRDSWYAVRFKRLREWVKDLPEKKRKEYFSIVANGTSNQFEPPTYAQIINILKHENEKLCEKNGDQP